MAKEKTKKFIGGTFVLSLSVLIVKAIGAVYKIPLSYVLDEEGMGYFNSAYTIFGFFYVLSCAGTPKAFSIFLSQREFQNEEKQMSVFRATMRFFVALGFFLFLILSLYSGKFAESICSQKSKLPIMAIAPSLLFLSPLGVMRGFLNYKGRFFDIAVCNIIEALSKVTFGLLLANIGKNNSLSIEKVCALTLVGLTVGSLLSFIYLSVRIKNHNVKYKIGQKIDKTKNIIIRLFKILFPITATTSIISATNIIDLSLIMNQLSKIGIDSVTANKLFGNYSSLAIPLLTAVVAVISQISLCFLPKLSESHETGDKVSFAKNLVILNKITFFITVPISFFIFLYAFEILDFLFPTVMSGHGFELLKLLSPSFVLLPLLTVLNTVLESQKKFTHSFLSLFFGAVVKLVFNIILIGNRQIGIMGVPIATNLSYLFSVLLSSIFLKKSNIKLKCFSSFFLSLCLTLVIFSFVYIFIFLIGVIENLVIRFVFSSFVSFLLYGVVCLFLLKHGKKPPIY